MIKEKTNSTDTELFVKQYYAQIYRYCFMKTSNAILAQDFTQETFCRFFQKIQTYQHGEKQRQILFTIAHHQCIDHYRKQDRIEYDISNVVDEKISYSNTSDIGQKISLVQLIETLPMHLKESLILFYYYEFKISNIAKITNTSISNVKYRLKTGKEQLNTLAKKEGLTYEEWF